MNELDVGGLEQRWKSFVTSYLPLNIQGYP